MATDAVDVGTAVVVEATAGAGAGAETILAGTGALVLGTAHGAGSAGGSAVDFDATVGAGMAAGVFALGCVLGGFSALQGLAIGVVSAAGAGAGAAVRVAARVDIAGSAEGFAASGPDSSVAPSELHEQRARHGGS